MGTATPALHLRGRTAELAVLGAALDRVASGSPAVVLVEGEPGIGKTRLLDEALADARGRGMEVAAGRAGELERTRPFGVVADAFGCSRSSPDPRRAAIAGLLAVGGIGGREPITVTSDPGLRFRAVDGFADLAEELALAGPLVVAVDDLQWADPSSLLTLGAISRRLAFLPVALIGCLRPSPRGPELDRLVGVLEAAGARQVVVRGLADGAVGELVAEAVAAEPGPGLLAEVAGAAGNPLYVTELLAALAQEGAVQTSDGRAEVAQASLPPTLRLTMLRRLSFLPEATLQALRAASILGSGFTLTDLSVSTARPALELSQLLADGIAGRVLEDDGERLRFRHDLIRDAIYEDLPLAVRRGLHREAGQRLAAAGRPALPVAEQLARGAGPGDVEAVGWLTRAAREAAPTSPDVAAQLLERAVGLMDPADPGRDGLLAEQASSLMWAGHVARAENVCRSLLDRAHDPTVDEPARACLAQLLIAHGRPLDALRELNELLRSDALTGAEKTAAWGWASIAHLSVAHLDEAEDAARKALAVVPSGDHVMASMAKSCLAFVQGMRAQLQSALQMADEAVRLADLSPNRAGHRYQAHLMRGNILLELDRPGQAGAELENGVRISEELGAPWTLPSHQFYLAVARFLTGEWDDAITEFETGLALMNETGERYTVDYGLSVMALIALHRGELGRAEAAVQRAEAELAATGPRPRRHRLAWARALILEARGAESDAFTVLADGWDQCQRDGIAVDYPALGPDLVRLAVARGDRARARDVAAAVAEVADNNPDVCSLGGAALRCRGLAEDDVEMLHAVTAYARGSRPLELGLAAEDAGTACVRHGMVDRARPLLDQAIETYERLDARRDLARAEALLREVGIRRGRRGTRGRPQTGWRSLTPTEHAIATLVAEGLSNPQIGDRLYVSRRTVQTHVAHVFTKLDLSSRAQLAAEVTRHKGKHPEGVAS